jgi:hypothetical protein
VSAEDAIVEAKSPDGMTILRSSVRSLVVHHLMFGIPGMRFNGAFDVFVEGVKQVGPCEDES